MPDDAKRAERIFQEVLDRLRAELGDAMREGEVRAWADAIRAAGKGNTTSRGPRSLRTRPPSG